MIKRILLENIRSHERSELYFDKGTNVLIGPMGSGKSTVLNAICFALFGTFPELQQKKIKVDDLLMDKPKKKDRGFIELEFTNGNEVYVVRREIKRGKGSNAELRKDSFLIEVGPQRVTEKITEILGINYDLFSRAVYAEQNRIDYFLEIPKSQRKMKIDELLKIEKYENARKSIITLCSRLESRIQDIQNFLKYIQIEDPKPIQEEIKKIQEKLSEKKKDFSKFSENLRDLKQEYAEIIQLKNKFLSLNDALKKKIGMKESIQLKIGEKPSEDESAIQEKIESLRKEYEDSKEKMKLLQKYEIDKNKIMYSISQIEDFLKQAPTVEESNLETFLKKKQNLELDLQKLRDSIEKHLFELAQTVQSKKQVSENIKIIRENKQCPICGSDFSENPQILEAKMKELLEIDKKIASIQEKIDIMKKEKENLEKALEDLEKEIEASKELDKMIKQAKQKREDLKKLKEDLENLEKVISSIQKPRDLSEILKEISVFEKKLEYYKNLRALQDLEKEIEKLRLEINELSYSEEKEKSIFESLKEIEKKCSVLEQEIKSLEDLVFEKEKRLRNIFDLIAQKEKKEKDLEKLKKHVHNFEILQKALQATQNELRSVFVENTNAILFDVWKKIYPYEDYKGLRLAVDEHGDYVLQLLKRDMEYVQVEGISSGGERSSACLALRISFSLVLAQNLSWLILDEPTHNLDKKGVLELSKTLREYLPKIVDQIFIITHDEELEGAASAYLYKLDRKKEADEPTKISFESFVSGD
ncbi:MAG: SMC family ATPase [archaeon]